jgi:hypothetical protein
MPGSTGAPHLACANISNFAKFAQFLFSNRDACDIDQQASQRPAQRRESELAGVL